MSISAIRLVGALAAMMLVGHGWLVTNADGQTFGEPRLPALRTIGSQAPPSDQGGFDGGYDAQFNGRDEYGQAVDLPESETASPMVFGPVDGEVPTIARPWEAEASDSGRDRRLLDPSSIRNLKETSSRRVDIERMAGREIVRQRYPDGKVHIARHVMLDEEGNYINDGQWKLFDRQGAPVAIGAYSKGAMNGTWTRLHSQASGGIFLNPPFSQFQGPFTSRATFTNGKLDGTWTIADAQGKKVFEMPYTDGARNGVAAWYFPNGELYRRMQFKKNVPDGTLVQYDAKGKVARKEVYQDGKRIVNNVTYYRPSRRKRQETVVHRGRLELAGEDDWWEARPAAMVVKGEDIEHGPIRSWYENGQTKMVGTLKEDARVGPFVWWHANGVKQLMGQYDQAGKKTGRWIWWHENGVKSIVGQYEDDLPSGQWRWWDEQGNLDNEEMFDPEADRLRKEESDSQDSQDRLLSLFGDDGEGDGGEATGEESKSDPWNDEEEGKASEDNGSADYLNERPPAFSIMSDTDDDTEDDTVPSADESAVDSTSGSGIEGTESTDLPTTTDTGSMEELSADMGASEELPEPLGDDESFADETLNDGKPTGGDPASAEELNADEPIEVDAAAIERAFDFVP